VAPPCTLAEVLRLPAAARLLLAEHGATVPLATVALDAPASLLLVVGAEGGFDRGELAAAVAAGLVPVGLGPRILRAESAAVAAGALCQARWGDLR
jgi:16S rRNA (uracil1498-N3)-methyltransferase